MKAKENENKPGPKEGRVKIDQNWQDAVKKALKKERPKHGWPEDHKKDNEKSK